MIMKMKLQNVKDTDIIAITKDGKFVGYVTVITVLEDCVLVDVGKKIMQLFNWLDGETIEYTLNVSA